MSWVVGGGRPVAAITGETLDGTRFEIDHWQLASTVTLLALWASDGTLRLTATGWALAWSDVQRGYEWGVDPQRSSPDRITLHLHDTRQTRPASVELIDITQGRDGKLRAQYSTHTAPHTGLSGDPETDVHLAIMLTMLRENGGTLSARLDEFLATAEMIQTGHDWRAVEFPLDGHQVKTFHLVETAG
ncbi:hypothetical protein HFP15_40010 [Amycolatopsis sp. K13G38]|uniref:Uncharacterized protein n=1 Tax=Amycolatopsis acididurans TaxID=2724524 RepID=A0ABX1JHB6_9PSEU|nr:hypothetical protein [Amycolatopsis acididurans]NKQ59046.1 hypothetical protein [Amycolatopsis acididurans]